MTEHEKALFIPAGKQTLSAIFSEPSEEALGCCVIMMTGAHFSNPNRNRLSVRLARRLSSLGYHTLRFDYRGMGESTGILDAYRLDHPFLDDLDAAVTWVTAEGIGGIALVGTCFGARTALVGAGHYPQLAGIAMVSLPVIDFVKGHRSEVELAARWHLSDYARRAIRFTTIKGLVDHDRRRLYLRLLRSKGKAVIGGFNVGSKTAEGVRPNREAIRSLGELGRRSVPALLIYGSEDDNLRDLMRLREGPLRDVLAEGSTIS